MQSRSETIELSMPRAATSANAEALISLMDQARSARSKVIFDCSEWSYVEPWALVLLASTITSIAARQCEVEFQWLSHQLCGYLQRMDFFQFVPVGGVDLDATRARNNRRGSLCELKRLEHEHEAEDALSIFSDAILGHIDSSPGTGAAERKRYVMPVTYALHELVMNALTHAKREGHSHAAVWIAAQYYPSLDIVKAAVADDGCGFLATLRHHPALKGDCTHMAALQAALMPRVSCNRNYVPLGLSENQGVGLTVTKNIVWSA